MRGMFSLRIQSSFLASNRLGHLAGETYVPERPKCRISDVKERLHNLSGSYGVSKCKFVRVYVFLVYCRQVLSSSANKWQ